MGFINSVVFRRDTSSVVVECRRCGTSLDGDASTCPVCDSDEIVTYQID